MKKLLPSEKIYIDKSKISNAGRGVFAKLDIKKGEIIEISPIIKVSKHDAANLRETILVTYFFYFGKNKEQLAVVLGFGSVFNHAKKANAKYKIKSRENVVEFIAISNINKNDEITIDYNPGLKNKNPLWFE